MKDRRALEEHLNKLQQQATILSQQLQKTQVEVVKLTGVLEYLDSVARVEGPKLKAVKESKTE